MARVSIYFLVLVCICLGAGFLSPALGQECAVWTRRDVAPPIGPRFFHAAAYDTARARVVVFGGLAGPYFPNYEISSETWEWDGETWTLRSTQGPSARANHVMAYDSARGMTVLFGGSNAPNETWEWDGDAWSLRAAAGAPPFVTGSTLAFDAARGVCVYLTSSATESETWEWNGDAWTRVFVGGPARRFDAAMIYDSLRRRCVLFGGTVYGASPSESRETWEFDGKSWTLRATTGPEARASHAMAFDAACGVTVLHGGGFVLDAYSNTWEWNGESWTRRSDTSPVGRNFHSLVFDSARGKTILFGGIRYPHLFADIWELDDDGWTHRTSDYPPTGGSMVWDSVRNVAWLYTLAGSVPGQVGETWEFDGNWWTLRASSINRGPVRGGVTMAFDSARGVVVLWGQYPDVGASNNETWEWNGSSWFQRNTDGLPQEFYGVITYDEARGVCVLHGGVIGDTLRQTWEWDGATWTQRNIPHQPPVHALAYDADRRVVVGFGVGAGTSQTWEYDGKDWTLRTTGGPAAVFGDSLAYHALRRSIVLHRIGYYTNPPQPVYRETWELEGTTWERRIVQGPVLTSSIVFDRVRGEIVAVGRTGIYGDPPVMESWRESTEPLRITQHPQSVTVLVDEDVRLQVSVKSTAPPVTYQWRRNGLIIHNAVFPLYIISGAQYVDSAEYDVVVSDICGSLTSNPARVIVTCREDWNRDGAINSQDYFEFLISFFAGDADFDRNGMTDENDHRAFVLFWSRGCR